MRHFNRPRPVEVGEIHQATTFEVFFDLVFVFALTQITEFMGHQPRPAALLQGLLLLLWFWYAWTCYTWLGNRARADVGVVQAGFVAAMAGIFVAALALPDSWHQGLGMDAPLILAAAYVVIRGLHLWLYALSAGDDLPTRKQVGRFAVPTVLAWIPLCAGAVIGGTAQTVLWAVAFVVDFGGGRLVSRYALRDIHSPRHFMERHGLVLIIALGESLLELGIGAGASIVDWPVMAAALLGFASTGCLWWLYFKQTAPAAGRALAEAPHQSWLRQRLAADAYSLAHFPLVAGVIYFALGAGEVVSLAASGPAHAASTLDWLFVVALYGGVVLYLLGRFAFLRVAVRTVSPGQFVAIGLLLLLIPAARAVTATVALGLLTLVLLGLAGYEQARWTGGRGGGLASGVR